jgi:aminomethyltransferase
VSETVLHSPLEAAHLALGARLIPFGGWAMPVQYSSILTEHAAVREKAGVFDISHMGQVFVTGADHLAWLDSLLTNNLSKLAPGQGQYTLMLNESGGVIDDLIAYRISESDTLLVVNASMIPEDIAWMEKHLKPGVTLRNESEAWAGLAIQGPEATALTIIDHPKTISHHPSSTNHHPSAIAHKPTSIIQPESPPTISKNRWKPTPS